MSSMVPDIIGIESTRSLLQALVDGIVVGSSYAMLGVAFALILGVTRRFHFAFSITYTVSAYLGAVAVEERGLPLLAAIVVGLVVGAVLACAIEVVVYRPIARRAGDNALLGVFVAGLGLAIAGENLIRLVWGNDARPLPGFPNHTYSIGNLTISRLELTTVAAAVVVISALCVLLNRTILGQQIEAVRDNPDMALAVGVDIRRVFLIVFALGTLIAGIAAVLDGMRFSATADMGNIPVFYAFVVAFIAGVERSPAVVGAVGLGLGVVARLSTLWVSETLSSLAVFGLLSIWITARVLPRAVRQLSGALTRPVPAQAVEV